MIFFVLTGRAEAFILMISAMIAINIAKADEIYTTYNHSLIHKVNFYPNYTLSQC
ncbi:hypothetical protein BCI9360_02374 [Bacillus sp. CECT 9360]|nr:hypothetical protein BCI9360_02374 [Bacillus sp. CECT 9360]